MIANEQQYRITCGELSRFRAVLCDLAGRISLTRIHPRLIQAELEAIESLIADLEAEIRAYDAARRFPD